MNTISRTIISQAVLGVDTNRDFGAIVADDEGGLSLTFDYASEAICFITQLTIVLMLAYGYPKGGQEAWRLAESCGLVDNDTLWVLWYPDLHLED